MTSEQIRLTGEKFPKLIKSISTHEKISIQNPDKDLISHLSKADIRIHVNIHTFSLKDTIFSNLKH